MIDETDIKNILKNYKVVAIVGVSREIIKYSYIVAEYLKNKGYRIIPINPFAENKEFEQIEKKQTALLQGGVVSGQIQLNDSNFDENVNKSDIVIVDFWAPWCGPCRAISPVIEELSKEYAGKVTFAKLKVDDNPLTASRFGVTSIQTILFLKKGREIDRIIELITRNLIKNKVEEHLR